MRQTISAFGFYPSLSGVPFRCAGRAEAWQGIGRASASSGQAKKGKAERMMMRLIVAGLLATAVGMSSAADALAKDKGAKGNANKVKVEGKPGKGPKHVPPGQIKRYTRGAKLPSDLRFEEIGDLSKWNLKPLRPGEKYIKVDNEVLKVAEDTQTVIDAMGIVGDLVK